MVVVTAVAGLAPALADTMEAALVRAYRNNPQANAQRAQVRSTDENVPQALSAYRPKVALTASAGYQYADTLSVKGISSTAIARNDVHGTDPPRGAGVTVTRRCSTAIRPPTRPVSPKARFPARARRCA
jgi:outer membrane protein